MKYKTYDLYTLKNDFIKKVSLVPSGFTGIVRFQSAPGIGECWYLKGEFHREDGPACNWNNNGIKEWRQHGKLHRLDGPAVEHMAGTKEYWINNQPFPKNTTKNSFKLYVDLMKLKGVL